MLRVETWKHGCRWVYSVTYDEGAPSLLRHALPLHRQYDVPGMVALDAQRLAGSGQESPDPNGGVSERYLNAAEIQELRQSGWSVAALGRARDGGERAPLAAAQTLERLVGAPVTTLAVSRQDHHHGYTPAEIHAAGYLAVFTREDRLNYNHVDEDLYALGRSALYVVEGLPLPARAYDPYWRLHQARDTGGWLVDSARLVAEKPADPERDVTPALLAERFEKVAEVGGVWRATPDEVLDYMLLRRAAHPRALRAADEAITFSIEAPRIPERARNRELTFTLEIPPAWQQPMVASDGAPVAGVTALSQDRIRFTLPVADGQRLRVSDAAAG